MGDVQCVAGYPTRELEAQSVVEPLGPLSSDGVFCVGNASTLAAPTLS